MSVPELLSLKKALTTGLSRNRESIRHVDALVEANNCKVTPFGLSTREPVEFPTVAVVNHPFPQILPVSSENKAIVAGRTTMGFLDDNMVFTSHTITGSALEGGPWHIADLGKDRWYLFNGTCVVYSASPNAIRSTEGWAKTGCVFGGRLFCGDLTTFYSDNWKTKYNSFITEPSVRDGIVTGKQNEVWWSTVGADDAIFYLDPTQMSKVDFFDTMMRSEAGTMVMPFSGKVLAVKAMSSGVIVYGENGICVLSPIQGAPTFGVRKIADFGIAGRGLIAGTNNKHVFLSADGTLMSLFSNLEFEVLDFKSEMAPFIDSPDATISLDVSNDTYYISDLHYSFILTTEGMTSTSQRLTSCLHDKGKLYGYYEEGDEEGSFRLKTGDIFSESRQQKTVESVAIVSEVARELSVNVGFRTESTAAFLWSGYKQLDAQGVAEFLVSGTEFVVKVKADTSEVSVEDIILSFRGKGKRFFSGYCE